MKAGTIAVLLLASGAALAAAPPPPPPPPEDMPSVNTEVPQQAPEKRPSGTAPAQAPGMTVVGEQDSPLGLYIMPWRNSSAQAGLDRPARLLEETIQPLDPEVFNRRVLYYNTLAEHLQKTGRNWP